MPETSLRVRSPPLEDTGCIANTWCGRGSFALSEEVSYDGTIFRSLDLKARDAECIQDC